MMWHAPQTYNPEQKPQNVWAEPNFTWAEAENIRQEWNESRKFIFALKVW